MRPTLMKHNPAFLSKEELIQSFVVRHVDLELLLERLRETSEGSNQHILLIGPRGIGKTTLTLRTAAAVQADPELRKRWYPLVFSEESYEVGTAAEFWLEALGQLAEQTKDLRWKRAYEQLKPEKDEKRLYERALARLMDFADEQGKRILLVVENLNMILGEQLSDDDGWALRHTLQNEHRVMLLATATTRFDAIDNTDKAMYDLFWNHDLRPLDTEECRKLWAAVNGQDLSDDRIRPIEILTGGNPRLLAILAAFATGLSFRDFMGDLAKLVDDHTSYFKSNLESLPTVERKVYVTLADIWSPATAKEVAEGARIEVNKASALLGRLVSRGAVVQVKQAARKVSYQLAERMYNIYHLMRRRSGEDSRVRAVVDFMTHLYEKKELVLVTNAIAEEACQVEPGARADHFTAYSALVERARSLGFGDEIIASTDPRFFHLEDAPSLVTDLAPDPFDDDSDDSLRERYKANCAGVDEINKAADRIIYGMKLKAQLVRSKRIDQAESVAQWLLELAKTEQEIRAGSIMILEFSGRRAEADSALDAEKGLGHDIAGICATIGATLDSIGNESRADEVWDRCLAANPLDVRACERVAQTKFRYGDDVSAEVLLKRAIGQDSRRVELWWWLAIVNLALGRLDEASESANRAVELDGNDPIVRYVDGVVARAVGRLRRAEKSFKVSLRALPQDNTAKCLRDVIGERARDPHIALHLGQGYLHLTEFRSLSLDALARKVFTAGWREIYPDAEHWAREAVTADPDILRYRYTLACLAGTLDHWPEAFQHTTRFLADEAFVGETMSDLIDLFILAGAAGKAKEALACLLASPTKQKLEPLVVAFQMILGEDYNAPQEVVEVAKDVRKRIEQRKEQSAKPPIPASPTPAPKAPAKRAPKPKQKPKAKAAPAKKKRHP